MPGRTGDTSADSSMQAWLTQQAHNCYPPERKPTMTSSVIAAQGPGKSLMFYWQTIGTVPWHAEQVAGPGTTFSAPSVAQVG